MLVRKTVTALFCDLDESVELGERLDPEALRRVHSRYFDVMCAVLDRHGGTVEKFIGDAIVAIFGIPHAHEDDALRAVRAAAEMRDRTTELNGELERDFGIRIAVQIGVNTGDVVVGEHEERGTLATGDAMNVAARLQTAAEPGEILIGRTTFALVKDAVKAGPLESIAVKGKRAGVLRRRLDEVDADAPGVARHLDTPLVGRGRELARLVAAFDVAGSTRSCRLVTVLGDAGIGKSRLAAELVATTAARARSFTGRCLPYGEGITFWPLIQMLRDALRVADETEALAGGEDAALVAEQLNALTNPGASTAGEETFWAVRRLFESLAQQRPLVLVFEDIHWAEPTFLDLIEYLAGWSRDAPMLLLCLARPDLLESRPSWASLRPNAEALTLEPLTEAETAVLLERIDGHTPLDAEARTRIAAAAEGNPLFLEQMAALIVDEGPRSASGIPPTIHALLAQRLDRLEPAHRGVIERAAVVGKEFWRGAVVELSPPDERAQVGTHLMALVRKELVQPEASDFAAEDGFRFRHILIREAAYDGTSKELRADLHERVATWIEARAADRATDLEEIVGYHLEQAYRFRAELGPVDEHGRELARRAGDLLGRAGRRAFGRDDMPAALKLLDRAVALVNDTDPARLELMRELSSACWAVGEVARAESLLNGLMEAAAAAGDRRVEWYVLLERAVRASVTDRTADELEQVARDAAGLFEELGDELGMARVWRRLAYVSRTRGEFGVAEEQSRTALEHALAAGDGPEIARAADSLCTTLLYGPAPARAAVAECETLLERVPESRLTQANVLAALAGLRAMLGDAEEARILARRAKSIYEELGLRLALAGLSEVIGPIELLAGDPEAAEREVREGVTIFAAIGHRAAYADALLAEALLAQGRVEDAWDALSVASTADEIFGRVTSRAAGARLLARRGELDKAVDEARAAVEASASTDALNLKADALAALAEVLVLSGHADDADAALREALTLYARKANTAAERLAVDAVAAARSRAAT